MRKSCLDSPHLLLLFLLPSTENSWSRNLPCPGSTNDAVKAKTLTGEPVTVEKERHINSDDTSRQQTPAVDISKQAYGADSNALALNSSHEENNPNNYEIEEVCILKAGGPLGLSIVGGIDHASHPFGNSEPGVFISKIVAGGTASQTPLRIGDRILTVNGRDISEATHAEAVRTLIEPSYQILLKIRHDPPPYGLQELVIEREYKEKIGMTIKGGTGGTSGNPNDPADEGIYISKISSSGAIARDGNLKVGDQILEVNGQSMLGATHGEAVRALRKSGQQIEIMVCEGYPVEVGPMSTLGKSVSSLDREDEEYQRMQQESEALREQQEFEAELEQKKQERAEHIARLEQQAVEQMEQKMRDNAAERRQQEEAARNSEFKRIQEEARKRSEALKKEEKELIAAAEQQAAEQIALAERAAQELKHQAEISRMLMLEKQRQDEEEALAKLEAEAERKKEEERAAEAARAFELQQRLDAEESERKLAAEKAARLNTQQPPPEEDSNAYLNLSASLNPRAASPRRIGAADVNLQHSPTPVSVNTEDNDIPFAGDSSDEDDSNITSAFAFGSSSARTSIPTADSKIPVAALRTPKTNLPSPQKPPVAVKPKVTSAAKSGIPVAAVAVNSGSGSTSTSPSASSAKPSKLKAPVNYRKAPPLAPKPTIKNKSSSSEPQNGERVDAKTARSSFLESSAAPPPADNPWSKYDRKRNLG
ncbi:SCRIB [Bugula neritina]|uniref:SCRIB n=1 Tax=Bugula neritina TaxID=10212 RepID=A0A7J7JTT1_BUGNE|nr:SCRIB [Bugula neritina]